MSKYILLVFASVLLLSNLSGASWLKRRDGNNKKPLTLQAKYEVIDQHLTEQTESEEVADNYIVAVNLLKKAQEEIQEASPVEETTKKNLRKIDQEFIEPLSTLISLLKLQIDNKSYCDENSYNIVKDNEIALGRTIPKSQAELKKARRIDLIVRDVALDVADDCSYSYPKKLKNLIKKNSNDLHSIDQLLDIVVSKTSSNSLDCFLGGNLLSAEKAKYVAELKKPEYAQAIFDAIKETHRDDSTVKSIVNDLLNHKNLKRTQVDHVLDEFLYKECDKVVDIFTEFSEQVSYLDGLNDFLEKEHTDDLNLLRAWLQYTRICNRIKNFDSKPINDNFMHVGLFH